MDEREELYLKHIDENTGRIAKALEKLAEAKKSESVSTTILSDVTYMASNQKELNDFLKEGIKTDDKDRT